MWLMIIEGVGIVAIFAGSWFIQKKYDKLGDGA